MVFVLAFNFDEEVPEYDMDSEDEEWLRNFNKKKVRFLPEHKVCLSIGQK